MSTETVDPYLSGNYAPTTDEVTVDELEISGAVPAALTGVYLRTGPNPLGPPPDPYHWFIGDGMIHGITLADGQASYRNRWVRTDAVADQLGEPRVGGPAQPMYDVSNTNVAGFAGRILSLTEGTYPYELSAELDTLGRFDFGGVLPTGLTAHPKIDPVTGELHGFAYWWDEPYLLYHLVDRHGRLQATEQIHLPAPVSMHDFAITTRNVLFFDQPAVFDVDRAMVSGFPYSWKPENGARVGVLPRGGSGDDVRWYETELGYTFHPMNAYENTDGTITVVLPMAPSVFADPHDVLTDGAQQRLELWTIDPVAGKVHQEVIDDVPQDFCRINQRLIGSRHRYGYTMAIGSSMPYEDSRVFKHDFVSGTRDEHDFGTGRHPGEMVFITDPDRASDEDGGWLMGFVHDDGRDRSSLVVLDAQRIADPPVAEVHVPRSVPHGFHGTWIPKA